MRYKTFFSVFVFRLYENSSHQQQQKINVADTPQYDSDDEDSISRCSSATSTTATIASSVFPYQPSHGTRKYSEEMSVSAMRFSFIDRSFITPIVYFVSVPGEQIHPDSRNTLIGQLLGRQRVKRRRRIVTKSAWYIASG